MLLKSMNTIRVDGSIGKVVITCMTLVNCMDVFHLNISTTITLQETWSSLVFLSLILVDVKDCCGNSVGQWCSIQPSAPCLNSLLLFLPLFLNFHLFVWYCNMVGFGNILQRNAIINLIANVHCFSGSQTVKLFCDNIIMSQPFAPVQPFGPVSLILDLYCFTVNNLFPPHV